MALQKSIQSKFGVPATFWTLDAVQDNFRAMTADIALAGYASQAAFDAGNDPLMLWNITLSVPSMRLPASDIEGLVAAQDAWSGATRVADSGPNNANASDETS